MKEFVTKEGYLKLQEELNYYKLVKRVELSEQIKFAVDLGDLRENAEYDAAMMDYQDIETRIYKIEKFLDNCIVIEKQINEVGIGSKIKVLIDDEEDFYDIVGPSEVDSLNNKISYLSDFGKKVMGLKINDKAEINGNDYSYNIKILDIK